MFCKQLSFPSLVNAFQSNAYGGSGVTQALAGITCAGSESSITDCDVSGLEVISNSGCSNAAVICSGVH